jgi:hypothetical protein
MTVAPVLRLTGVKISKSSVCYGKPLVSMSKNSSITIGDKSVLASHSSFTALGVSKPCIFRTMRERASIKIGSDTGLSGTTICAAKSIIIGNECLIGADVIITDNDFHAIKPENRRYNDNINDISAEPVLIEDNVFIGARAIILKGVTIGKNSIIGAGAIVSSNVPPNVIITNKNSVMKNLKESV